MNYAMMRSAKPDDAEPEPAWIYMEIAASPSWMNINYFQDCSENSLASAVEILES